MRRTIFSSLGCLRQATAGLAVLTAGTVGPLHAQQAGSACKLLQVSEIEAAIGGKAEKAPSGSKESIPGAMTLDLCEVVLKGSGVTHPVRIQVVTDMPMDGADAIKARNTGTAREEQWKTAGAKLEQSSVGSAICILAGRPNVASHTTCSIPRGKGYVEVEVVGDVGHLPSMQTVAALVQKAVSRL